MTETLSELLARCRHGDAKAVESLIVRFRPWALNLACALVDDPTLAEDIVQEAFISAISALKGLRESEAFPGWLRQIIRRMGLRAMAKRREFPLNEPDAAQTACASAPRIEVSELRQIVRGAIQSLPAAEQEAAVRFYIEQQSCTEIASALAVPKGTVKRRLYDARVHLRSMLTGYVRDDRFDGREHETNEHRLPF